MQDSCYFLNFLELQGYGRRSLQLEEVKVSHGTDFLLVFFLIDVSQIFENAMCTIYLLSLVNYGFLCFMEMENMRCIVSAFLNSSAFG